MSNFQKRDNMIKTRKTFEGTTKDGKSRKLTIFMTQESAKALLQAASEAANGVDGACITIFLGESQFGKGTYSSIALEASTPSSKHQAVATQTLSRQAVSDCIAVGYVNPRKSI